MSLDRNVCKKIIKKASIALGLMMLAVPASACGRDKKEIIFDYLKDNYIIDVGNMEFGDYYSLSEGGPSGPVPFSGSEGTYVYRYGGAEYSISYFDTKRSNSYIYLSSYDGNRRRTEEMHFDGNECVSEELIADSIFYKPDDFNMGLKSIEYHPAGDYETEITVQFDMEIVDNIYAPIREYVEQSGDYAEKSALGRSYNVKQVDVEAHVTANGDSTPIECEVEMIRVYTFEGSNVDAEPHYDVAIIYPGDIQTLNSVTIGEVYIDDIE